jgi:hypothetical protein
MFMGKKVKEFVRAGHRWTDTLSDKPDRITELFAKNGLGRVLGVAHALRKA